MITKKYSSLMFKLVISIGAIFLAWFLLLTWSAWKIRESIRLQELKRLESIVAAKADLIHAKSISIIQSVTDLSEFFSFLNSSFPLFNNSNLSDSKVFQSHINRYMRNKHFNNIYLISPDGTIIYSHKRSTDTQSNIISGPYKNTKLATVFNDALLNKQPKISDFLYYVPASDYAAFVARPIMYNQKIIGVIAVQIRNDEFNQIINDYHGLGEGGDVHAAIVKGSMCIYMSSSRFGHHPAFSVDNQPPDHPLILGSKKTSGSKYYMDKTGSMVGAAWKFIPELNWSIMVKMPESELLSTWKSQSRILFYEFTLLYIAITAFLYYIYRSIRGPYLGIMKGVRSFTEGNFSDPIIVERNDEIGMLADTYNMMAERISSDFSALTEKNERLLAQKTTIESLHHELEQKFDDKARQLRDYIHIVDEYVITSTTDLAGTITSVSQAFCSISGYSADELIGRYHNIVRHPDMDDTFFKNLWETISSGHTWHGEVKNKRKDGSFYWVDTTITPNYENGKPVGYTSIRHDITDKKRAEELAITDSLTGLFNRRHFNMIAEKELNRAKRNNATIAFILLDVDYFKQYNDNYGHLAGDNVLIEVSKVLLEHSLRANDHSFRLGGEEFAVLMYGMDKVNTNAIGEYIRSRIEALELQHAFSIVSPVVTVSIGIALDSAANIDSFDELYKRADDNLYHSKANGRNQITFK